MSKTIRIFYKEIELGQLQQVEKNYIYKANPQKVELAHKKGYPTYLYKCDESFLSSELPYSITDFIPDPKQYAICIAANIENNDSDFEKLYKVASLKDVKNREFHLEV